MDWNPRSMARDNIVIEDVTNEELENILAYLDANNDNLFHSFTLGKRYLQVDVRYSRFNQKNYFKLTIPKSWIAQLSTEATLDTIRRGVLR
jgi:hypothetical protein